MARPTRIGKRSEAAEASLAMIAIAPKPAIRAKITTAAHHRRRASQPATANNTERITRMVMTRTGLSLWPSTSIALRATPPGVSRMTSSATATTGASRIFIKLAVR